MLKKVMQACLSFGNQWYTLTSVVKATGMERKEVRHRLWKLETAGLISRFSSRETPAERGRPTKEISYRNTILLKKRVNGADGLPNRKTNGWDKLWTIVRALRRFTRNDLAAISEQSMTNVIAFTKEYRKRGYLRCLGGSGRRNVTWMLVKDRGTRRPIKETNNVV